MNGKADVGCLFAVNAIESVTSRSILKDFVFKLFVLFFECIDHQFHFPHIHIVIVRIGVNEKRFVQIFGIMSRRSTCIFFGIFFQRLPDMIIGFKQIGVGLVMRR
jgi:hypothetical protein